MIGIYGSGDSFVHMLDPRLKLIITIGLSLLIYSAQPAGLVVLIAFVILLAHVCGMPLTRFAAGLRPFVLFFAVIFVFHLILTPGDALIEGFSILTVEGLSTASVLVVRFILLILFSMILIFTTSPSELHMAAAYFLRPLGTFGTNIAFMVGVAVTFIPQLFMDKDIILKAQTARGYSLHGLRGFTAFIVPLLYRSLQRADEFSQALESRCYHPKRRYYYYSRRVTKRDFIAGGVFLGLIVSNFIFSFI